MLQISWETAWSQFPNILLVGQSQSKNTYLVTCHARHDVEVTILTRVNIQRNNIIIFVWNNGLHNFSNDASYSNYPV